MPLQPLNVKSRSRSRISAWLGQPSCYFCRSLYECFNSTINHTSRTFCRLGTKLQIFLRNWHHIVSRNFLLVTTKLMLPVRSGFTMVQKGAVVPYWVWKLKKNWLFFRATDENFYSFLRVAQSQLLLHPLPKFVDPPLLLVCVGAPDYPTVHRPVILLLLILSKKRDLFPFNTKIWTQGSRKFSICLKLTQLKDVIRL